MLSSISEVLILTKSAPPFSQALSAAAIGAVGGSSREAEGFSIDVLSQVFAKLVPAILPRIEMLAGNEQILSELESSRCDPSVNPQRLCVGAAAISITSARAARVDFLTSYFTSGWRLLTQTSVDPVDLIWRVLDDAFNVVLAVVAAAIIFALLVSPLVWAAEFFAPNGNIFLPSHAKLLRLAGSASRRARQSATGAAAGLLPLLGVSLLNAARWTVGGLMGADLANPRSRFGNAVVAPLVGAVRALLGICATAALAGVFVVESAAIARIRGVGDLGSASSVCVNVDAKPVTAHVRALQERLGFRLVETRSVAQMLDAYWAGTCTAVVYDAPLLEYNVTQMGYSTSHGLIGEALNFDPYGFAMPREHPLHSAVDLVLIDVVRSTGMPEVLDEWMNPALGGTTRRADGASRASLVPWLPFIYIPATAALLICTASIAVVVSRLRRSGHARLQQAARRNSTAVKEGAVITTRSITEIAMLPSSALVHEIALELRAMHVMIGQLVGGGAGATDTLKVSTLEC